MARRRLFVGSNQGEELGSRGGVVTELAVQCGGDRPGSRCSDATYGHAQMLGLHDDTQTARRNVILEPVSDLLRQPFLHLGRRANSSTTRANLERPRIRSPGR